MGPLCSDHRRQPWASRADDIHQTVTPITPCEGDLGHHGLDRRPCFSVFPEGVQPMTVRFSTVVQLLPIVAVLWIAFAHPAPGIAQSLTTRADAAGGCDGVKSGRWGFHTSLDEHPWWQVDLGQPAAIDRVLVFNRCDAIWERAAKMLLRVSDDAKTWRTVYRHDGTRFYGTTDGKPLAIELEGVRTRYVRVELPAPGYLHLDEVEVYGLGKGKKKQRRIRNLARGRPADQSSTSTWSTGVERANRQQALATTVANGLRLAADLRRAGVDVSAHEATLRELAAAADSGDSDAATTPELAEQARKTVRSLGLLNPLLDFDRLLVVKRRAGSPGLGLPANWQGNCSLPRKGFDDEVAILSGLSDEVQIATLHKPDGGQFVGDVDLHWDGKRLLYSSLGSHKRWQIFELDIPSGDVRQVTPGDQPDVDSYDACYLPNDDIIFGSTATFTGVPCVFGGSHVAVLYRMTPDGENIRQLCFEQDHDWCPTVLHSGRVLYTRWEYADTPHAHSRILFHMDPDGRGQAEYYGSNSYWPNGMFYARPVPGEPTMIAGIVSGHHGVRRMGELVVLDPARGRSEASGVVRRIPGDGRRVEAIVRDQLVNASWPKFLHPYPLSSKYFIVAAQPGPRASWGIYLVDVFDNVVLLHEEPGYALLEPLPLRPTPRPPVIPDRVDPERDDAIVKLENVYAGPGLEGIPPGTVKRLRVFSYHYSYRGMGGLIGVLGMDGPWDIRRLHGTVPVESDGSALFRVPANTPISIQPLDAEGKAVQLMRSWMTAMPGEVLSCVGCHEKQNTTPVNERALAFTQEPKEIEPWYGPARGFSYAREVQPVIDRYCVECHDGQPSPAGEEIPDLRGTEKITDFRSVMPGTGGNRGGRFSVGYANLHRYVRRPGIESDFHLLTPMEFHADTTELVQLLRKGHHGVDLDDESWDRLITWIDLNTPYHGTWTEAGWNPGKQRQRRRELGRLYAGMNDDPEADADLPVATLVAAPKPARRASPATTIASARPRGWPFDATEAARRQAATSPLTSRRVDLGGGVSLDLVLIPAGEFLIGNADPAALVDERPAARTAIESPFWMGRFEVTNEQYALFDPAHDSHVESKMSYQFGVHGYPVDGPAQPVVRLSWQRALAFCQWLSERTGNEFTLPTEGQWEYACRAGSQTPFWYGDLEADFSGAANLGDRKLRELASNPYTVSQPLKNATPYDDWVPKDTRFDDGALVSVDVGRYRSNAWGLHDMHGNVAEWTRSTYRPYPYDATDGRNDLDAGGPRVVRGGSWRDRPQRAHAAFRLAYRPYQRVFNVGFRVICAVEATPRTEP